MKQSFIIAIEADGKRFRSGIFKEDTEDLGSVKPSDATRFESPYHAQARVEQIFKEMPDVTLAMVIPIFTR